MAVLAAAVDARAKVLPVDVPVAAQYGARYTLDGESVSVVGGNGSRSLAVWRAQNGTTADTHKAGTQLVPGWFGDAQWPVTVPPSSSLSGQSGAALQMPADGSVRIVGGKVFIELPTTDPGVSGQLWNKKGIVTVSGVW